MKLFNAPIWAILALLLCLNSNAQDIIYTISGEINSHKTPLDSIALENLSKQTHLGFGSLPVSDDYRINLSRDEYWGSTSVSDLQNEQGLQLVKNLPGIMAVVYRGQTSVSANISLHNANGQRLAIKENQVLENGSLVEAEIGNAGIYFLTISTPIETRSFKATGLLAAGKMSIATQSGAPIPLKSGQAYTLAGTGTEKGDNVKVSVFKCGYVAQPVELTVDGNETLVFPLEAQTPPEVETLEATNILSSSATLNGNVVSEGNSPITERGFYWSSTNENPGEADSILIVEGTTGSYSAELSGLELNTNYFVRAFAINSQGTTCGEQKSFTTSESISLCDALDNCNLAFTNSGNADWFAQTAESYYGGSAVRSGSISHSQQSTLETTVTGPGFLSFYWKVSSESGYDKLKVYIESSLEDEISGSVDWELQEYEIPEGTHTLKWSYTKDGSFNGGLDCGWLDKIVFTTVEPTLPTVTTSSITNISQTTAVSGGEVTLTGFATVTARGVCWNTSGNPTIADSKTTNGTGSGTWVSELVELQSNTTYYVRAYATNSQGTVYGEQKSFTTSEFISLCDALDNCNLSFTNSGNAEWFAQTAESYYGGSAARSGSISHNQQSTLETTVTGPGIVSFYWKVSSESSYDKLNFYIGTTLKDNISGNVDWELQEFEIPEGTHTLKWSYTKDGSFNGGQDCGWLDKIVFTTIEPTLPTVTTSSITNIAQTTAVSGGEVTLTGFATVTARGVCWNTSGNPTIADSKTTNGTGSGTWVSELDDLQPSTIYYVRAYATNSIGTVYGEQVSFTTSESISLCDALDNCNLAFTNSGNAEWFAQTAESYYGGSAARSGSISHNQQSTLETTVTGPGIVSFYWKVSSESGYDKLKVYIESSLEDEISGSVDWELQEYEIPEGTHTLKWSYTKDGSFNGGQDCGWLDKIVFATGEPSLPTVTTTTITNITNTTASSGGEVTSSGFASITARGIVWSTSQNPTLQSNTGSTTNGSGTGSFTSNLTGLSANTTYHVRAFATNSQGTNYGDAVQFTTTSTGTGDGQKDTQTTVVDVTNPATGKTWMDRNLGASRAVTSSTDFEAYGDLYQWGRAADGHQKRNSPTTSTLSNSDTPGHGDFILAPSSPYDWRSPQNTDLWQGVNGTNNPCPSGYRLPTSAELDAERKSWSRNNAAGAFASPLKLPLAGSRYRSSGSLSHLGSRGFYWSSTYSRYLTFTSSYAFTISSDRAYGNSVRCLKD